MDLLSKEKAMKLAQDKKQCVLSWCNGFYVVTNYAKAVELSRIINCRIVYCHVEGDDVLV